MSQISGGPAATTSAPVESSGPRRRGRPRLADHAVDELRAKAITAAEALFATQGVGATSVDDVARAMGSSRATLYRLVGSKDALVLAVTMRRYDEWVDGLIAHVRACDTAADIVTEAVLWTMRSVRRDPSLAALFTGGTASAASGALHHDPSAVERITRFSRELAAVLEPTRADLRPGLHPEAVSDRVLGVLLERLRHGAVRGSFDLAAELAWLQTWLLPAVLAEPPPVPPPSRRAPRRSRPSQAPETGV